MTDERTMACHTTPRLDALIKILQSCTSVADIGCDHAYLPILLAREGNVKKIIASDISEGPLLRARQNIKRFKMTDKIELRLGSGLDTIAVGETDAIVIAGMGGNVISDILHAGECVAKTADFIALQPMTGVQELRSYLYKNGYVIEREVLVCEDRRIYTIMIVKSGETGSFDEFDCYISPALRKYGGELYEKYFARQKHRIEGVLEGLRCAKEHSGKIELYEKILSRFESCEGETDEK